MSSGEINKKRIYKTDKSITKLGLENSSAKFVPENSVLIALAGQGKTRGKVAINNIELTINQSLAGLIPTRESYYEFIFYNLEKRYFELRRLSSGAGSRGGLNKKLIQNIKIQIPDLKEQTLISKLSETLDKVLTLYDRKLKLVKLIYKELENKVYNNDLIKQTNFTKVKLGEILKEKNIKSTYEDQYPVLSSTNSGIELRNGRTNSSSNIGYKVLSKDELVLSPQNLWLGNININFDFKNGLVSPSYKVFSLSNDINTIYLNSLLHHPKMMYLYKVVSVQGASVVRRNLDIEAFENLTLKLPSIEAQNKIGNLLNKSKQLIDSLEKKKVQISKIKTTLLNTMFI